MSVIDRLKRNRLVAWVRARAREKSTWVGVALLVGATTGYYVDPEVLNETVVGGLGAIGTALVALRTKGD